MHVFKGLRYALLGPVLVGLLHAPVAQAAKTLPLDARVQRLERMLDNRVLIQLLQRLESLQQEVRELRGEIELQSNELVGIGKRNRDLYLDTDDRLQALEGRKLGSLLDMEASSVDEALASVDALLPATDALIETPEVDAAAPAVSALAVVVADDAVSGGSEKVVYDQAYMDLVNGRYTAASTGFRSLLATYPEGELVDNARYWLGETYYVERRFEEAQAQFSAIVEHSPQSAKIAEAKLKLGFVLHEQGETDAARTALQAVVQQHPDSTVSLLATRRLEQIDGTQ